MKQRQASKPETWLSAGILMVLVFAGLLIGLQQKQLNPAVVAMRSTDRPPEERSDETKNLLKTLPPGLAVMTPMEKFTAETLYEKIDGQAELYLSSGFKQLNCQRLVATDTPELWLEIFVYDMGTDRNAFAVYSRQRRENAQPVAGLPLAYRTDNAFFASHGTSYIEIIAAVPSDQAHTFMDAIAASLIGTLPAEANAVSTGLAWFPPSGRDPDSLTIIPANAFGFEKLDQMTTVTYTLNDTDVTAFVSKRASGAEAQALADDFHAFLLTYGGQTLEPEPALTAAHMVEIMDTIDVIFVVGPFIAGVHEALDRSTAVDLAVRLERRLKEIAGGA